MHTSEITYAARDSDFDGFAIKEGHYLALMGTSSSALTGSWRRPDGPPGRGRGAHRRRSSSPCFTGRTSLRRRPGRRRAVHAACSQRRGERDPGGPPVYYYMISAE